MIVKINKKNYQEEVLNSEKPVLLEFGAPWCVPCKSIVKIVEELDKETDIVKFAKVDIEESPEIAAKNGVTSIPVLILFKNGKVADKIVGIKNKAAVAAMINK